MPTQIEIQPEIADKLFALAEMRGVSIDALLGEFLNEPDQNGESPRRWQLAGSIELLDENLESGSREITRNLQNSLLKTAENL